MNNPEIGPDMRRRVVPIYLDAGVEKPWERLGPGAGRTWQHPHLMSWAAEQRPRLARAALVLASHYVKGWEDVGRETPTRTLGTFEEWARVVGGVVTAAGVDGFGGNID